MAQETKQLILNRLKIIEDLKKELSLKQQMVKEVLSEELMVLYATEGVTEITDLDGNTRQFKVSVKLS